MSQTYNSPHGAHSDERVGPVTENGYAERDGAAIDLRAVLTGMWQRKILMLTIIGVIMLAASAFVFTATPKYKPQPSAD